MRTKWFKEAGWGVFIHYLAIPAGAVGGQDISVDSWNKDIDNFKVEVLAKQLAEAGANYLFITLGQNSGFFLSPNATYDSIVGRNPSRCSRRDLVADLAEALKGYGIPLLVYLPSHAPACDRQAVEQLKCTPRWDASAWQVCPGTYVAQEKVDDRLSEFQHNWEAIITEWSQRWGKNIKGWWFDGCYFADTMYRHDNAPNFKSFADAARAGNANSIVAFNGGVKVPMISMTTEEDYLAGEISNVLPLDFQDSVYGSQYHLLTYLGKTWGVGKPRFLPDTVSAITQEIIAHGGVISWDVPINRDGTFPDFVINAFNINL